MINPFPVCRVSARDIRHRFNAGGYLHLALAGQLQVIVTKNAHPSPPLATSEPICTRSQILSYRDGAGFEIARIHQYVRPDGSMGASGLPDPKRLFEAALCTSLIRDYPETPTPI